MKIKFKIKKHILDNGLKIFLIPMKREIVSFYVIYKVGSRNESEGKRGISHLLEHMMFKGTEKLKPEEFSRIIQKMGGVDNAFTTEDFTLYYETVPSDAVYKVIEMEADRMQNIKFKEFESEKRVVIEERKERTENSPYGRFWENFSLISYSVHPYRYPIIGFEQDLLNIKKTDLIKWYNTYYSPDNAFIVVSGGLDENRVIKYMERTFGKVKKKKRVVSQNFFEPEQKGERKMILEEKGMLKILGISFQIIPFNHPDFLPLSVFSSIIGGTESSRLNRILVLDKNLSNEVSTFCEEKIDNGLFIFYSILNKNSNFDDVIDVFWKEVEKIKKQGIKETELNKVKNMFSSEFLYRLQSTSGRAYMVSHFELHGILQKLFTYLDEIEKLKVSDVVDVCKKYIKKERANYLMLC